MEPKYMMLNRCGVELHILLTQCIIGSRVNGVPLWAGQYFNIIAVAAIDGRIMPINSSHSETTD